MRRIVAGREFLTNSLKMLVPQGNGSMEYKPADYPLWDQFRIYDTIVSMMKQDQLTAPGLIEPLVSIEDFPETFELIKHNPAEVVNKASAFESSGKGEYNGCARSGIIGNDQ